MKKIHKLAYAKLNLDLHVTGKRQDGFHELKSIVIPLDFYDEILLEISQKNEVISNIEIDDNLILKVVEEFQKRKHIDKFVKVTLNKNIPIASGLGGGSANAAATINGIVELFDLNLPLKELENIANKLGSDILYCLYNKPAVMFGRGDKLKFIDYPKFEKVTLIVLPTKNITSEIFKKISINKRNNNFDEQLKNYQKEDVDTYIPNIENDLLKPALAVNKVFETYYKQIEKIEPRVKMTGSGPTLFIINSNENTIKKIKKLKNIQVFDIKIKK